MNSNIPPAPNHILRPELYSALVVALEDERAGASTPSDLAAAVVEAVGAHYLSMHGPVRTAELLDELASAAGVLAARIEPEEGECDDRETTQRRY